MKHFEGSLLCVCNICKWAHLHKPNLHICEHFHEFSHLVNMFRCSNSKIQYYNNKFPLRSLTRCIQTRRHTHQVCKTLILRLSWLQHCMTYKVSIATSPKLRNRKNHVFGHWNRSMNVINMVKVLYHSIFIAHSYLSLEYANELNCIT